MRIITDEETEIAMTAGLMKTNQPGKTCYRKRLQTWIISGNCLLLLKWIVQNQVEDTRLGWIYHLAPKASLKPDDFPGHRQRAMLLGVLQRPS